jgi:hypothetical protein
VPSEDASSRSCTSSWAAMRRSWALSADEGSAVKQRRRTRRTRGLCGSVTLVCLRGSASPARHLPGNFIVKNIIRLAMAFDPKKHVGVHAERVSHVSSTDYPGVYPDEDNSWRLDEFKKVC